MLLQKLPHPQISRRLCLLPPVLEKGHCGPSTHNLQVHLIQEQIITPPTRHYQ
jgi:hypothetical protein